MPAAGEFVILPDVSVGLQLEDQLNPVGVVHPWKLHLIAADFTNDPTKDFGDYVEASFGGYAPRILQRADWGPAVVSSGCAHSEQVIDPLTWTSQGPNQTIYGVMYTDAITGLLLKVYHQPTARVLTVHNGDVYVHIPEWTLGGFLC